MTNDKKLVEVPVASKDGDAKKAPKKAELSADDQQVKDEVEMLVTRCCDDAAGIAASALQMLSVMLRTASGSVGSVPKPLKYVRPLWQQLVDGLAKTADAANARAFCDLLSFIGMTKEFPEERTVLKYRLRGSAADLHVWGHEYLRFLAGEVAQEWNYREENAETEGVPNVEELKPMADQIMRYMVQHQDEPTACDLAIEVEQAKYILEYCDEHNYARVAQYLLGVSQYLLAPENTDALEVVFELYRRYNAHTAALRIALQLNDRDKINALFAAAPTRAVKAQMALICGRHRVFIDLEDEFLNELNSNLKLNAYFMHAARDLDSLEPTSVDKIYKNYLVDQRMQPSATNSYMHNLASTFVSAMANAGFSKDDLISKDTTWVSHNKEHRQMSAAASIGLVHLWDHNEGLSAADRYSYSEDPFVRAGVALANGLVMCGVKSEYDPALGLLGDKLGDAHRETRIGAILGLGYAYAGTHRDDVKELLMPLVADSDQPVEVQSLAAYALALVFPGSCDEDISETILTCVMDKSDEQLGDVTIRYLILALGCVFLGSQDRASTLIDACSSLSSVVRRYTEIVVSSCAYAATGNVVQIQKMFAIIAEEEEDESTPAADPESDAVAPPKPLNAKEVAALAVGLIALGEGLGADMCRRSLIHVLLADQVKKDKTSVSGRAAVPLAYALLSASDPQMPIIETLHRLSHDSDPNTAMNAILAMGIVAAGSNNARVATMLRNLAGFYHKDKDSNTLFVVRLAQGLTALGKGHLSIHPMHSDRLLMSPSAVVGLLGLMHSALDLNRTILDKYHYMLYTVVPAIAPRMLITIDAEGEVVKCQSRVGMPVDTVAVPGKPKNITGFQTQTTPVLMSVDERAEIVGKHTAVSPIAEGIVIVEEKPQVE